MTNPYNYICDPIEEWCLKNYYTSFLVTIKIGEYETTEVLEFNGDAMQFEWRNDWWEGDENVILLGFMPIDSIRIYNYPDHLPSEHDDVNIIR